MTHEDFVKDREAVATVLRSLVDNAERVSTGSFVNCENLATLCRVLLMRENSKAVQGSGIFGITTANPVVMADLADLLSIARALFVSNGVDPNSHRWTVLASIVRERAKSIHDALMPAEHR